jgi:hypothetical protein
VNGPVPVVPFVREIVYRLKGSLPFGKVIMAKALNTIIVVLDLPRAVPQLIIRVNGLVAGIEEHPLIFPKPTPPLAQVKSNLGALMTAQANYKSSLGSVVKREEARKLTVADAKGIHAYVQGLAVANPEQADVIAGAASMTVRKTPARHKPPLSVKQLVSMSVKVIAKAVNGGQHYEWEYSLDGATWIKLPPTTKASTTVTSLQPGRVVWFRCRVLMRRTGLTDWGDPVSFLVG